MRLPPGRTHKGITMKKFVILLGLLAASACSQATDAVNSDVTQAKLQSDTAKYFATSPKQVRIGNMKQSVVGTAYQALFNYAFARSQVEFVDIAARGELHLDAELVHVV